MAAKQELRSVDAFSQLPFIRPAATQHQQQARVDTTIRLFGRDFSNADAPQQLQQQRKHKQDGSSGSPDAANNGSTVTSSEGSKSTGGGAGEASRKFECHYCCRNFPTSQALGGHQNAHKRERQHARRAHLEASLSAHYLSLPPGPHVYGALFGGYAHHQAAAMPAQYPVWAGAAPGMYGNVARSASYGGGMAVPGMVWRPAPVRTSDFVASEATAAAVGSGEVPVNKDGNNAVVMSVVPSCLTGGSPTEMGRSEMMGQKEGVLSLDLCL